MIYVMSDLHGEYDKYIKMLDKINFREKDTMYILGDVVDRGLQPMPILLDMMKRKNIVPIFGNHELMALPVLEELIDFSDDKKDIEQYLSCDIKKAYMHWNCHGAETTIDSFLKLNVNDRVAVLNYLKSFKKYETIIDDDENKILLVHAGLGNYTLGKSLEMYSDYELTVMRPMVNGVEYGDFYKIIVGHMPTTSINGNPEMYSSGNLLFIDCGASYNGRLCCLCIDAMKAIYV